MEDYRELIIALRQAGTTVDDILEFLNEEEHIKIGRSKLYQYLQRWNAQVQRPALTDEQIQLGVIPLAQSTLQSDTKIASKVSGQFGIDVSHRQVKRARLKSRNIKLLRDPIEREARRQETTARIKELLRRGGGLLHGYRWAVAHLRRHQGYRAHHLDVSKAQ